MATVREMMTGDPESVDGDATVQEAVRTMRELNVGAVPVVADGRVAGIVTDRDVTVRVIAENRKPADVRVREIASSDVVTVAPGTEMGEASALMARHQIRRLPVVEDGKLVGMLSLGDLSVEGSTREAGKALREISTPAEPER
jgi:CBS domain-containing protein